MNLIYIPFITFILSYNITNKIITYIESKKEINAIKKRQKFYIIKGGKYD